MYRTLCRTSIERTEREKPGELMLEKRSAPVTSETHSSEDLSWIHQTAKSKAGLPRHLGTQKPKLRNNVLAAAQNIYTKGMTSKGLGSKSETHVSSILQE